MANQETFCEIHQIPKKKLPQQYYCTKCKNEYQNKRNKRLLEESKRLRKNVTSEADPAKRDEKETPIIFD